MTVPIFDPDLPDEGRGGSRTRAKVTGILESGQVRLDQTVGFAGGVLVHKGDDVLVDVVDGTATVTSNLTWWPMTGVVQAVDEAAKTIDVLPDGQGLDGQLVTMPVLLPFGAGTVLPPVGWQVVFLDTPGGAVALGTTSAPLRPAPPTPGGVTPDVPSAVQLAPSTGWTMRSGSRRTDIPDGQAMQGHWTTGQTADNTGFVVFPGPAGQSGRPVTSCKLSLARSASSHGNNAPVAPVLRAHANAGPGPAQWVGDPVTVGGLTRGQSGVWDVPAAWGAGLADGSIQGVALVGTGVNAYFVSDAATWSMEVTYA
ncbi:MAG: hypothetical protein LBK54_10280 [Propionibacteriaceae bacterium]|jgi:hypothetical protein|nr:hypothetical protein [Propionibacteriaceae bacterium]